MHSTFAFASLLLAASSAFAAPHEIRASHGDKSVTVILQNQATETGSQTTFQSVNRRKTKSPVGSSGPFETIEISVGDGANQDLRCQVLDTYGNVVLGKRNANVDTTFSDAGKGPWTFKEATEISQIICDPAFVAVDPAEAEIRVTLADDAAELATQTVFAAFFDERIELPPSGSSGPFTSVEISVGSLVDAATRCQVLNRAGNPIVATRGENVDTTFSDADKGAWTFNRKSRVSKVICDPAFVAAPQ